MRIAANIFISSSKQSESGGPSASVWQEGLCVPRRRDQHVTKSDIVWNGLRNAKVTWICSILHIGSHSVNQITECEMDGTYGTYWDRGGREKYILGLVRKPDVKSWLRRHGGTREANITTCHKVIGWKDVEGKGLYKDRYKQWAFANALMKFQVF